MSGWEVLAWVALAALTVLRVALVVGVLVLKRLLERMGVVAVIVAVVRGVRSYDPAAHLS